MTCARALRWAPLALLPLVLGGLAPATPTGTSSASLVALTLAQVKIVFAAETPAGPFTPPGAPASFTPLTVPPFVCLRARRQMEGDRQHG